MTVINTTYSSLEDAWGSNFDHESRKYKKKKTKPDPICDLYAKRYKKAKKPYISKHDKTQDINYKEGRDESNYYGYGDDASTFTRMINPERQKTSFLTLDGELEDAQCVDVNNVTYKQQQTNRNNRNNRSNRNNRNTINNRNKVHFNLKPEDDDDIYLQEAINEESKLDFDDIINSSNDKTSFKTIYSNVYDESEDEVEVEDEISTESEDSPLIEQEVQRNNYIKSVQDFQNTNKCIDERKYLDILIYILSGIILIFMMEQFIQIGMRLKSPY